MRKSGGIIIIIASVFGVLAALLTLFVGGVGSALDAGSGDTVVLLGWGGLFFSFLNIILGAICLGAGGKKTSILAVLSSLLGIALGGTFVAICMVLAFVGAIITFFDKKEQQ